jgi:hypothetical protein
MLSFGNASGVTTPLALPNTIIEEEKDAKKSNYGGFVHFDGEQLLCS